MLRSGILKVFIVSLVMISCISFFAAANDGDYRLQPEDVLHISVYEQPDLDTRTRISSTGDIAFPLLGKLNIAGLTVIELKDKITELLEKDYLVNPQVQVFIEQYHVKQIAVLGAVNKPGKYDMFKERKTTVMEAIAMAEGFSEIADINGTRVIRTEGGREMTIPIKVTNITKKGRKDEDVTLEPGDIVFVPESFF
ncbi:MAG: polysaccharide biosynthesis/export family protein [Candidatus Omnitrophica bacterium]|nr:polysaccharide biosynthesis/export family protein [Candidatus Omnitrophota bacterium]